MLNKIIWNLRVLHGKSHENNENLRKEISHSARIFRNKYECKELKRESFTIFSNNCIGGGVSAMIWEYNFNLPR